MAIEILKFWPGDVVTCYLPRSGFSESVKIIDISKRVFKYAYLVKGIRNKRLYVAWLQNKVVNEELIPCLVIVTERPIEQDRWVDSARGRFINSAL